MQFILINPIINSNGTVFCKYCDWSLLDYDLKHLFNKLEELI